MDDDRLINDDGSRKKELKHELINGLVEGMIYNYSEYCLHMIDSDYYKGPFCPHCQKRIGELPK